MATTLLLILLFSTSFFDSTYAHDIHTSGLSSDNGQRTMNTGYSARQMKAITSTQQQANTAAGHQSQQQQRQLPACQVPPAQRTNSKDFDYYTLTALWPPSLFQYSQSYTAGQFVEQGYAGGICGDRNSACLMLQAYTHDNLHT